MNKKPEEVSCGYDVTLLIGITKQLKKVSQNN